MSKSLESFPDLRYQRVWEAAVLVQGADLDVSLYGPRQYDARGGVAVWEVRHEDTQGTVWGLLWKTRPRTRTPQWVCWTVRCGEKYMKSRTHQVIYMYSRVREIFRSCCQNWIKLENVRHVCALHRSVWMVNFHLSKCTFMILIPIKCSDRYHILTWKCDNGPNGTCCAQSEWWRQCRNSNCKIKQVTTVFKSYT